MTTRRASGSPVEKYHYHGDILSLFPQLKVRYNQTMFLSLFQTVYTKQEIIYLLFPYVLYVVFKLKIT